MFSLYDHTREHLLIRTNFVGPLTFVIMRFNCIYIHIIYNYITGTIWHLSFG